MKKLLLLSTTFLATPLLIFFCLIYLFYLSSLKDQFKFAQDHSKVAYAALPSTQNLLKDRVDSRDSRVEILTKFLKKYKSDLIPFAENIVVTADRYNLDYRLIPAIGMQESNLCKKAPKNSYNCWGFAIYGDNVKKFASYPRAIEAVTKTLALEYKAKGLDEPEEIMRKYTPSNEGSWARSVNHFMEELQNTTL